MLPTGGRPIRTAGGRPRPAREGAISSPIALGSARSAARAPEHPRTARWAVTSRDDERRVPRTPWAAAAPAPAPAPVATPGADVSTAAFSTSGQVRRCSPWSAAGSGTGGDAVTPSRRRPSPAHHGNPAPHAALRAHHDLSVNRPH